MSTVKHEETTPVNVQITSSESYDSQLQNTLLHTQALSLI